MQDMLWRSHMAYDFGRNVKDKVAGPEKAKLKAMTVQSAGGREMEMLGVSAGYALYRNRGGKL